MASQNGEANAASDRKGMDVRIVIRSPDLQGARSAHERLKAIGVRALPGPRGALAESEGEDIALIDAAAHARAQAVEIARALAAAPNRPSAIVAGVEWLRPPAAGLHGDPSIDAWIPLDAPATLLARHVEAVSRAAACREERARRRATAEALRVEVPERTEKARLKCLYIGAPSRFFLALERAFAQHSGLVTAAFTSFTGFDHLHDEAFEAVALNGAEDPATAIALCAALRRNAGLHHLPTLVLVKSGDAATETAAIERGAAAVVAEDTPAETGLDWLFEAIRRERERRSVERELGVLRDRLGDAATGLMNARSFEAHLARLAEDHHAAGRELSLVAFKVLPAHGARTPSDAAWRRTFREAATLAGRLIRTTDCAAAFGRDLILVALPATALAGARRTSERMAAVGECTAFAGGDVGAPLVFEQSTVALQSGESGAALMARAMAALEAEGATA
jgi:two-component system cell cycle response regulator PopA